MKFVSRTSPYPPLHAGARPKITGPVLSSYVTFIFPWRPHARNLWSTNEMSVIGRWSRVAGGRSRQPFFSRAQYSLNFHRLTPTVLTAMSTKCKIQRQRAMGRAFRDVERRRIIGCTCIKNRSGFRARKKIFRPCRMHGPSCTS